MISTFGRNGLKFLKVKVSIELTGVGEKIATLSGYRNLSNLIVSWNSYHSFYISFETNIDILLSIIPYDTLLNIYIY